MDVLSSYWTRIHKSLKPVSGSEAAGGTATAPTGTAAGPSRLQVVIRPTIPISIYVGIRFPIPVCINIQVGFSIAIRINVQVGLFVAIRVNVHIWFLDWWLPVRTGTMPPTDQKPDPEEPDPDNPDPDKPDPDPEMLISGLPSPLVSMLMSGFPSPLVSILISGFPYENLTMLSFSYVIDASPLSGSLGQYPHRDTLTSSVRFSISIGVNIQIGFSISVCVDV